MKNRNKITSLAAFVALTAASDAAIVYSLNSSMTSLSGGVAYWDTSEVVSGGTLVGFHQVVSANSPNILSASPNSSEFTFDTSVASSFSMTWESSFMSSGGGGAVVSPSFEDGSSTTFISDTNGSRMFFDANSEFVSGDAAYGASFGMQGQTLVEGDSGTGFGNNFISGAAGSEWELEGRLLVGDGMVLEEGRTSYGFAWGFGGGGSGIGTVSSGVIPEPSGISLFALCSLVIGLRRRR